jgi:hypothetical protein
MSDVNYNNPPQLVDDYGHAYGHSSWRNSTGTNGLTTNNPYLGVTQRSETAGYKNLAFGTWSGMRSTATVLPNLIHPWANLEARAYNKVWGRMMDTDFNASMFVAEARKSSEMIATSAMRLAKAWRLAKRGDFQGASIALTGRARGPRDRVASNWLELQYGWMPLLSDTYKALQFVTSERSAPPQSHWTGSAQEKRENLFCNLSVHMGCLANIEYHVTIRFFPASFAPPSTADLLGMTDPLSVAWELVPYSFVLDWFLPIGAWLQASAATRRIGAGQIVGTRYYHIWTHTYQQKSVSQTIEKFGEHKTEQWYHGRSVGPPPRSLGLPTINALDNAISLTRSLNAVALLSNLAR